MTALVTSTGSTKKAEEDLSIAANLARAKHIDLSTATGILTKTLAGSTRGLTALGLNLDIGSGKLKTIASDTTAYQTAQGNLHLVNQQVADGTLKGADAYSKLLSAHDAVDKSSQKLQLDQGTIAKILDTVNDKTKGAAQAFGQTLAGQEDIADAKAHNLGTSFGQFLTPAILDAKKAVVDIVTWFEKHKTAAEALAGVIGGVLAVAVGAFAVNTGAKMVRSVQDAGKALSGMASKITGYIGGLGEAEGAEESFADTSEETGEASSAAFGPIGLAIMGLVVVGMLVATHWKEIGKILSDVWHGIESTAKTVWDDVSRFFEKWGEDLLLLFAPVVGIPLFLATHWHQVLADVKSIWGEVTSFFSTIPAKILGFFTTAGSWLLNVGKDIWKGLVTGLTTALVTVSDWFAALGPKIFGFIVNANLWLLSVGVKVWQGLTSGLTTALTTVANWFGSLGSKVLGFVVGADSWLLSVGAKVWNGLVSGLSSTLSTVASWFGSLPKTVEDYFLGADKWLVDIGKDIIDGLLSGLKAAWNEVTSWWSSALGFLENTAKTVTGSHSPSTVYHEIGLNLMQGLANGIEQNSHLATNAMEKVAAAIAVTPMSVPTAGAPTGSGAMSALAALSGPGAGGAGIAGAGAGTTINVSVTVQGNVATERDLGNAIYEQLLQKAAVNGTGGQLVLAP